MTTSNSFNNCFTINDSSWADECEDEISVPCEKIEKLKISKEKKVKSVKVINLEQDKPVTNIYGALGDSDDDEPVIETPVEVTDTIKVVTPKAVDLTHEEMDDWWETGTKTKKKTIHSELSLEDGDELIMCNKCRRSFVFTRDESEYFKSLGLEPRKKCRECKQMQKFTNNYGKMPNHNRRKTINID